MALRAGLLVKRSGERLFLSASLARHLVPLPRLTQLPWDSAHMTLVGGEVVAVLELGPASGVLVLCEHEGQAVALSGLDAEQVGFWPASDAGVRIDGANVPALDLGAALAQFKTSAKTAKDATP